MQHKERQALLSAIKDLETGLKQAASFVDRHKPSQFYSDPCWRIRDGIQKLKALEEGKHEPKRATRAQTRPLEDENGP